MLQATSSTDIIKTRRKNVVFGKKKKSLKKNGTVVDGEVDLAITSMIIEDILMSDEIRATEEMIASINMKTKDLRVDIRPVFLRRRHRQ